MTLDAFLAAVSAHLTRYRWYVDDLGMLRTFLPPPVSAEHTPMTALAYVTTGTLYEPWQQWEYAALALGLTPHDSARLVSAEDGDQDALQEPALARALRAALVTDPALYGEVSSTGEPPCPHG